MSHWRQTTVVSSTDRPTDLMANPIEESNMFCPDYPSGHSLTGCVRACVPVACLQRPLTAPSYGYVGNHCASRAEAAQLVSSLEAAASSLSPSAHSSLFLSFSSSSWKIWHRSLNDVVH
eukprot:GHVU01092863.1.p1 GENE.GHVU01092863.1~~GHVU01092863.1.p1  ORF type:complete len:119 (+),score=3.51 GHVU01092863.1:195-551(+)